MRRSIVLGILMFTATTAWAETRYVNDELHITLRTGPSTKHQIVRTLVSGTRLEVLEENEADPRYVKVRTDKGAEGWVLAQYLVNIPIARDRLRQAETRVQVLGEENARLSSELETLRRTQQAITDERDRLGDNIKELESQLVELRKAAADPLALRKENKQLRGELSAAMQDATALREENDTLKDSAARDWFITGGAVVLGSIIFGMLITRIRWRRRSAWHDSF